MTDTLAALKRVLSTKSPEELAEIDATLPVEAWTPSPGPQTQALNSRADLLLYGGAAGGGKTDLLLGAALTRHQRSVIFRRAYADMRGVVERLIEITGDRDGLNLSDMVMRRDSRIIEFGALEKPGAELSWQGRAHDFIGFDEGAQLAEAKVRFVMGWLRSTMDGQRCRVVIASNPPIGGEGGWLLTWFAPWLDPLFHAPAVPGELRWAVVAPSGSTLWLDGSSPVVMTSDTAWRHATLAEAADADNETVLRPLSRSFIPARLDDNPFLRSTGYRAQIMALDEPLRSKLLKGDFLAGAQDHDSQVIPSAWIRAAQERWAPGRPSGRSMLALGVDVAQGGKDETVLSPLYGTWFAEQVVRPGAATRNGPDVAALVMQTMRDRCQVTIDLTGGWGGSARDQLQGNGVQVLGVVFSEGSGERTRDQRFGFLNMRAQLWWKMREALRPEAEEPIALPPDRRLAAELAAPLWTLRGNRVQIESKDDIRKRLGSSTDRADAAILAWHDRGRALLMQKHGNQIRNGTWGFVPEYDPYGPANQGHDYVAELDPFNV